jgi:hypothetical protein
MGSTGFAGYIAFGVFLGTSVGNSSWVDFPNAHGPRNLVIAVAVVGGASAAFKLFLSLVNKVVINRILILWAIVIVFECAVAITAFVYPLTILASIDEHWDDPTFDKPRLTVEGQFTCCGFGWYDSERTCGFRKSSNVETKSCKAALAGSIEEYGNTIGFAVIGMAGAEIVMMLLVCWSSFCVTFD